MIQAKTIYFCGLIKGNERYLFLFDDKHKQEVCSVFGEWAINKELSFTWWDAEVLRKSFDRSEIPNGQSITKSR